MFARLAGALGALLLGSSAFAIPATPACQAWEKTAIDPNSHSDQVVVMRGDGTKLFEWADGYYQLNTPHALWSVSKTITTTIAAIAINQGKLATTDLVSKYIPASRRSNKRGADEYAQLTIDDLMSMTSGFKWSEHTTDKAQETSDLPMFYYGGYNDMVKYVLAQDFMAKPGKMWNYSSANAILLMGVLRSIYGSAYNDMPWNNLFKPMGMSSAHFEQDRAGNYVGAAYIHLSALDLAKLGQLYLRDGVAPNGTRLLPTGWVTRAQEVLPTSLASIHTLEQLRHDGPYSKGTFWLNTSVRPFGRPYPNAPADMYMAEGLFGQVLAIYPSQNLILVRTGHDGDDSAAADSLIDTTAACFGKGKVK